MRVAIYARKSTEQGGADEARSVTRQVDHARAFAEAKGWTPAVDWLSGDGICDLVQGRTS